MLLLHILLSFLAFASCTAKPNNQQLEPLFGYLYWYPAKYFGAKGPRSERRRLVIPIGKVPKEYTNNVDHNLVFFTELGEYLPLEDKYISKANGYFDPTKGTQIATVNSQKSRNIEDGWINIGWPWIGKWSIMGGLRHMGEGRSVRLIKEKRQQIFDNMLKNFEQVSKTFKINVNADDLGQKFRPYIQFGYTYWLEPKFLGFEGKGSDTVHLVVPLERVNDPRYPDHDLIFVAQISRFIPNLGNEYKGNAMNYFTHDAEAQRVLSGEEGYREINIKFAQVAESITFCYQRHWGLGRDIQIHMQQATITELSKNMRENWNSRSPNLKLDFSKPDLNQYHPSEAPPVPEGKNDFKVAVGHVYWTKGGFGGLSRPLIVIPVGEVPDSPNHFFIAELSIPYKYLLKQYWKPAKDYFTGDPVIRNANEFDIKLNERWVNTEWAVVEYKFKLSKHQKDGRDVQMNKVQDIYKSMLKNYEERRKNGETDFSRRPPQRQNNKAGGQSARGKGLVGGGGSSKSPNSL